MDSKPVTSVAVILPVRNGAAGLPRAVASILAQTHPPEAVVLAVGPSTDGTEIEAARLASVHPCICVVHSASGRTPDALNLAAAATRTDVIVRVDAGSLLQPGYIERALATLASTGAANVGAVQVAVGDTRFRAAVASATTSRFGVGNAQYRLGSGDPRPVDTAYLGVFRRDAFEAVGGYDEHFTRNQDYELNWRLRDELGGVWLDPQLEVEYQPRGDLASLAHQYWQYGWWRAETIQKHPDSLQPRQLAAPLLVLGLVGSAAMGVIGFRRLATVVPTVYLAATAAAVADAPEVKGAERATLAAVFPAIHLSWGAGLLTSGVRLALKALRRKAH